MKKSMLSNFYYKIIGIIFLYIILIDINKVIKNLIQKFNHFRNHFVQTLNFYSIIKIFRPLKEDFSNPFLNFKSLEYFLIILLCFK